MDPEFQGNLPENNTPGNVQMIGGKKHRRRKTRKAYQKGGEDRLKNIIAKCNFFSRQSFKNLSPPYIPKKKCEAKENQERDGELSQIINVIRSFPNDDILIIKAGSNDLAAGFHTGSLRQPARFSGRTDNHYLEKAIPVDRPAHLISISPEIPYEGYEYPVNENTISENIKIERTAKRNIRGPRTIYRNLKSFYDALKERLVSRQYVQTYFPINLPSRECPVNSEFIQTLLEWEGPLFIINAMSSPCHNSIKYIIDLRTAEGKITGYSAFSSNKIFPCHFDFPIYPSTTECEPVFNYETIVKNIFTEPYQINFFNASILRIKPKIVQSARDKFYDCGETTQNENRLYEIHIKNIYSFFKGSFIYTGAKNFEDYKKKIRPVFRNVPQDRFNEFANLAIVFGVFDEGGNYIANNNNS